MMNKRSSNDDKVVISGYHALSSNCSSDADFLNLLYDYTDLELEKNKDRQGIVKIKNRFGQSTMVDPEFPEIVQWLSICVEKALVDSNLSIKDLYKHKVRVIIGTFLGELGASVDNDRNNNPFDYALQVSLLHLGLDIKSTLISSACVSSAVAIGLGYQAIITGQADIVIAGGYEKIGDFCYYGMKSLRTLSGRIKPFSKDRDGTILGDGAGVVVLERESNAKSRNCQCKRQILGYGLSNDAFHIVRPDLSAKYLAKTIRESLNNVDKLNQIVSYINVHGTGTFYNDLAETKALTELGLQKVPVSSTKPITGHTLGAAGVIELILSMLIIEEQLLPVNHNYHIKDNDCSLNIITQNKHLGHKGIILSNSLGFGGVNCTLALGAIEHTPLDNSFKEVGEITVTDFSIFGIDQHDDTHVICLQIASEIEVLCEKVGWQKDELADISLIIDVKEGRTSNQEYFYNKVISKGSKYANPSQFLKSFPGYFGGEICRHLNLHGHSITICDSKNNIENLTFITGLVHSKPDISKVISCKVLGDHVLIYLSVSLHSSHKKANIEMTQSEFKRKFNEIITEYAD